MFWIASPRPDWQAKSQEIARVELPICEHCLGCQHKMGLLEYSTMYVPCWSFLASKTLYHVCACCMPHVHLDPVLRN